MSERHEFARCLQLLIEIRVENYGKFNLFQEIALKREESFIALFLLIFFVSDRYKVDKNINGIKCARQHKAEAPTFFRGLITLIQLIYNFTFDLVERTNK